MKSDSVLNSGFRVSWAKCKCFCFVLLFLRISELYYKCVRYQIYLVCSLFGCLPRISAYVCRIIEITFFIVQLLGECKKIFHHFWDGLKQNYHFSQTPSWHTSAKSSAKGILEFLLKINFENWPMIRTERWQFWNIVIFVSITNNG